MYKKRNSRAQLLLCQPKPVAFLYVLVAVAVVVAKALFYLEWCKCSKNTHWDWLNRV